MEGESSNPAPRISLVDLYYKICRELTDVLEDSRFLWSKHVKDAILLDDLLLKLKLWGEDIDVKRGSLEKVQDRTPRPAYTTQSCMRDIHGIINDIKQYNPGNMRYERYYKLLSNQDDFLCLMVFDSARKKLQSLLRH